MITESDDWFKNANIPWWGLIAKKIFEVYGIPKHIAFVMDGNRRYARRNNYSSLIEGHSQGFEQMIKVLNWCSQLGIIEITVYAFSIENFKRNEREVEDLMKMAQEKFEKLLANKKKLIDQQICYRFFGQIKYLPIKIQKLIQKIEKITLNFKKGFINICLAYTSQDEIARALEWIRRGVQLKLIHENDINAHLIDSCLDTSYSLPIDILLRTSGECRLSDFLLWQCSNSYIHFENVLWPEIKFWHLFKAIVCYQHKKTFIKNDLNTYKTCCEQKNEKVKNFIYWMNESKKTTKC